MAWRRPIRGWLLVAYAASSVGAQCGADDDPVRALTARRDFLASGWRPKAEFWSEVERKGTITKQAHAIANEIAAQDVEATRLEIELSSLRAARESTRATTQQARERRAELEAELRRLVVELQSREQRLIDFEARRRGGVEG